MRNMSSESKLVFLTDLRNAGELHDRTLSLPICKRDSMFAICIRPGEHVAVSVENLSFEVMVLAPSVFAEFSAVLLVCLHGWDTTTARSLEIAAESQFPVRRLHRHWPVNVQRQWQPCTGLAKQRCAVWAGS